MDIQAMISQLLDEEHRAEQLASLDDEALGALASDLRDHARAIRDGEVDGVEPDDVDALSQLRDALHVISGEQTSRVEAAAELARLQEERAAQAAELAEELLAPPAPEATTEVVEPEETVEVPVAAATEPAPAPAPRPTLAELAANRPRHAEPVATPVVHTKPRWQLTDGKMADLEDLASIGERMLAARNALISAPPGFTDKVPVATLRVERPSELDVREGDDLADTMRKIEAVTAAGKDPSRWTEEQQAIVASGGWAAPAEPRYQIPNISSAARPVRDALPSLGVSRGSLTYVKAARLSSITTGGPSTSGAAISIWENSTDTTPGGSTKQRQTFAARSATTVALGAVVARGRFGNLQTRGFPEDVAHDIQLMAAAHARISEQRILDNLITLIAINVTQTGFFGTARDVRQVLAQARAEMQYSERTKQPVRALINDAILEMAQQDVFFQAASGEIANLLVSEAEVRAIIAASGVNVAYHMDVPSGGDYFRTNATGENLADYPDDFEIPIFFDGSALFLDGGELNLGIVRDSTLNNTNDYEMFYETFEDVAYLGPYAKTLTLTTCPNGISQASATVSTVCSGS